jgi:hypothetical protein
MRGATTVPGALAICLALGCSDLPGEVVGTYRIRMTLEENQCGARAVYLTDGRRYAAELRAEGTRGYWRVPGKPLLAGKYNAPEFHFEYQALVASSPFDAGTPLCRLLQSDVLNGRIRLDNEDAGEPQEEPDEPQDEADEPEQEDAGAALEAELEYTISAEPGANCAAALAPEGAFEKLPCSVRYSLHGEPTKPF